MGFAINTFDRVAWQRKMLRLHVFLQACFGILAALFWIHRRDSLHVEPVDSGLRRLKAGIQQDRAKYRFDGVSEHRWPLAPAASLLTFADTQVLRNIKSLRERMERRLTHEVRAHARKLPFRQIGKLVKKRKRDGAVQHAIANELQSLIVWRTETAVRQRLTQQARLAKRVSKGGFETQRQAADYRLLVAEASKSKRRLVLPAI